MQRADGDGGLLGRGRRDFVEHPVKVVEVAAVELGVFPEGAERAVGEPGGLGEVVGEPGPGGVALQDRDVPEQRDGVLVLDPVVLRPGEFDDDGGGTAAGPAPAAARSSSSQASWSRSSSAWRA